jgi:integrase
MLAGQLLRAWAAERKPSPATLTKYARAFAQVARITGFEDLQQIGAGDVVKFKQRRLNAGIAPETVADDVFACSAVCKWAVANQLLPSNPFTGLAPKLIRRSSSRRQGYTDEEARRILTAAREEAGWLRWAPWLLCFTGARVGELAEMRREHIQQDGGVWILNLVPTALHRGKNETFQRMIPLHPAVIEEGFLDYVAKLQCRLSEPLFPDLPPDPRGGRVTPATSRMARWMRRVVRIDDPRKAPSHSWRHRMEDELRKVRASAEVQDAITGRHNPRNAGAGYGIGFRGMPRETLAELSSIPCPVTPLKK